MLYVTTRSNQDIFTAQRAMRENRGLDGGMYVPFQKPVFPDLDSLGKCSFGQTVSDVLNLLFQTKLTSWDVDFCIGRYPVRLKPLRHRILIAESWHNPQWSYEWMVNNLTHLLCGIDSNATGWIKIAVRIAVLFGIFGELRRNGVNSADISVVSSDFSAPISAWYAREWGLPVGNVVCCCNENHGLWDLICQGQFRTDAVSIATVIPLADCALPEELERFVSACGGAEEILRYLEACQKGYTYCPNDEVLEKMRQGLFVSVVSSNRLKSTIPSVYRTHDYLMSPYTALAYGGLLDYRAKKGETRHAVILADRSPTSDSWIVAKSIGITEEELHSLL